VGFHPSLARIHVTGLEVTALKSKFGTERNFSTTVVFWSFVEQLHTAKVQYLNDIAFSPAIWWAGANQWVLVEIPGFSD